MEQSINGIVKIAIELIICALVLGAIAACGTLGNSVYYQRKAYEGEIDYLESKSELFYYDNKMVSGADIIELMLTHTGNYSYYIRYYNTGGALSEEFKFDAVTERKYTKNKNKDDPPFWSYSHIYGVLSDGDDGVEFQKRKFKSTLVRDPGNSYISAIVLEYRE